MSVSIPNTSFNCAASGSSLGDENDLSKEQIKDLVRIRGEFLANRKNLRGRIGPWKTVAELIRTAFAPDHLVPIPENSTRIIRRNRNKNEERPEQGVLIHRIVKAVDRLRISVGEHIRDDDWNMDDCLQYCIDWLIGVEPVFENWRTGYSWIRRSGVGKIESAFYPNINIYNKGDIPPSKKLKIPQYETVDHFVYNYIRPILERTALFSPAVSRTRKRKREAEALLKSNKKVKPNGSESSASSSSSSASSSSSSQAVSGVPFRANKAPLLLPVSLSSSSPLAPHVTGNGLVPAFSADQNPDVTIT
jgi:hypothetical protein